MTAPGTQGATRAPSRLLLVVRPGAGAAELWATLPAATVGPLAGFCHLPELPQGVPWPIQGIPAGVFASPGYSPHGPEVQLRLLALGDASSELMAHLGRLGLWLDAAQGLMAHEQGALRLSPKLYGVAQAVARLRDVQRTSLYALAEKLTAQREPEVATSEILGRSMALLPLRSKTLPPATHTNCYVLGEKHLTLVDPGTAFNADTQGLLQLLDSYVAQGRQPTAIWISHHHEDHVGAAMTVRERYRVPIMAHALCAQALRGRVTVDRTVEDGARLQVEDHAFTALHTPGHAHGHLAFYRHEGGHLLSGDNVLGAGTPIVPPAPHGDMSAYMTSLRRMLARPLGMLLPGHGAPCAAASARLQQTIVARMQREALLLQVLQGSGGPMSLDGLVAKVYRGLGAGLRGLAELSTRAHLEKLVLDQKVVVEGSGKSLHWRLSIVGN